MQNSSDLKSENVDVDDVADYKQRIADVLSGMKIDDVRKLVDEIEQGLRRRGQGEC